MAFTRPKAAQIDFDITNITDPLIRLNSGETGSADKDVGIVIERGDDTNVAILFDESADEFILVNTSEDGTTSGNVTISSYANLQAGTITATGNLTVDTNTLYVDAANNRIGIGTTSPAYQVEIENTGANALLVLDRTDGAACFIEGQATRSAFGSVGATDLALAYNSFAVVTIGANGAITVNPDGDGFTFPTTDGSANQVLATNGSGTLSFVDQTGGAGSGHTINLARNGAMTVAQRGTLTGQGGANQTYTAVDGWASFWYQGTEQGRFTTSQDTDVPAGSGFGYSLKIDCTTAEAAVGADEAIILNQPIEAQNLQHLGYGAAGAKTLTLSFWWKSPKTGIQCVQLHQTDAGRGYVREFTVASADTWEFFTVTFPGDASGTINNDTGSGLQVRFPLFAGTNRHMSADAWSASTITYATSNQQNLLDNTANNIYLTGVQLEVGSVATDFEHEDYGTTLAKCQRYYWRQTATGDDGVCMARVSTTTAAVGIIFHPVVMRTTPTLDVSNVADLQLNHAATSTATTNITAGNPTIFSSRLNFIVASGLTVGNDCDVRFDGGGTRYLGFSSEL